MQDQQDQDSQSHYLNWFALIPSLEAGDLLKTLATLKTKIPLPLYIGLSIHTQTRGLNHLHKIGISVSYKRVIEVENSLASALCTRFEDDDVVCPSHLHKNLFTVGALDNIDHNLSSTTAQGSFHGAGSVSYN